MNKLFYGDNLDILRDHIADESVDLIYIDPPFNSKRNYNMIWDEATAQTEAFSDTWSLRSIADEEKLIFDGEPQRYSALHDILNAFNILLKRTNPALYAYLTNIGIRIVELHRVLKKTGSLYLHCDPTAGHYLKLILDAVFGRKMMLNEIVWCYDTGGRSKKKFPSKHDTIFWYSKTEGYRFEYDQVSLPRNFSTMHEPVHQDEDGRYYQTNYKNGELYKYYLEKGQLPNDWWSDIQALNPAAKERLGYPTQKPERLLERIIRSATRKNDLVLDAYCGCGTTVAVAQNLNRRWIGIDITYLAVELIKQRLIDHYFLEKSGGSLQEATKQFNREVEIFGIPRDMEGAVALATKTKGDRVRKEFEKWAVFTFGGVFFEKRGADSGIDGYCHIVDLGKEGKAERLRAYIQVKSGKVGVSHIREFSHVLDHENAPMGIFITLEPPTKDMLDEIRVMPKYVNKLTGQEYDRVYIVTVEDLIEGNLPNLPMTRITKQAKTNKSEVETEDFFE
ncbi:MAG: DNA methyltransferase [bacterium]|nr:DNA methyltransferase [bacterium]